MKHLTVFSICIAWLGAALIAEHFWNPPKAHGQFGQPPGVFNTLITATSGTPIRVTTSHIVVDSLMIQAAATSTPGLVYICVFATTPSAACSGTGQLGGELAAATSTAPGSAYSYPMPTPGLDLSLFWIDSSANSPVIVSYHVK